MAEPLLPAPALEPDSDVYDDPEPDPQIYELDPDPPEPPPAVEVATSRGNYIPPIMVGLLFFWLATQAT